MANFVWPLRVYYEDTDAGGVVYYANYLRYLERARTEWLRSLGVDQGRLMADTGLAFAVRSINAEYLRSARLDDELRVASTLASLGRAQVHFDQRIERAGETLLTAQVRVACLDIARGRPAPMPPDLYEQLKALT
jgi:acyl-CoA thioester hydrolase